MAPFIRVALFVVSTCRAAGIPETGSPTERDLRERVAAAIEAQQQRLARGLLLEEMILGRMDVAAVARLPAWSLFACYTTSDRSGALSLPLRVYSTALLPRRIAARDNRLWARLYGTLVLDGTLWELVAADYLCQPASPSEVTDVARWTLRQHLFTTPALNIYNRRDSVKKASIVYHKSAVLCAVGACFAWREGQLVSVGPHLSEESQAYGPAASAIVLSNSERHAEDLDQAVKEHGRQFLWQRVFDAGLPVLVRHARKVSVDPESGLVVVEAEKTKLWLSPQYGYQPVRREWYCLVEDHLLAVDEFSDYREIGDGVWLPFRWRRTYARDAYRGEVSDAVVVVRRAELRAPDEAELRELFLNAVPEERTIVVDFRWIRNPFTGRPRHVTYPFRRDPAELAALREQAVARARAQLAWILRVGPRARGNAQGNAAVPLAVAALLLLAMAGLFVWIAWHRRRRKQDA